MASPIEAVRRPRLSRRLSLSQLLALVAAGPALVITIAVIVGIIEIAHQNSIRSDLLTRVEPANAAALRLFTAMLNQETGLRGYELTGDTKFLQPYRLGLTQLHKYEPMLKADAVPGTASDLAVVEQRINTWESLTAKSAIALGARAVDHGALAVDATIAGKAQFDAIRSAFTALGNTLLTAVKATKVRLNHASTATEVALSSIGAALIISVLSAGYLLRRFVTRPIGGLADSARRVADGELSLPLVAEGAQELELLAGDVDDMRLALLAQLTTSREMQDQLAVAADDLQRSNTELEQFAYVASHDLQEPLRKVTSFVQLLEDRYSDQLDERGHQYIGFAVDGAKRMQQLINDLLAFSRVGRTGQPVSIRSLNDLAAAAVDDLQGAIEDSGAHITVGVLPTLAVEPALIRAVFQNLLANAMKFHSDRTPEVTISAEPDGEEWLFSCTDNGIGIEAQYAERIFVIFQRLHTREAYPGTGIGLAMCRKIVEHHGGRMWLDQDHAGGTRMLFTLPAEPVSASSGSLVA